MPLEDSTPPSPLVAQPPTELDWKVKLPVFEGPLDLLLYLIKREEIDIYQIPMERITQHYLDTLRLMQLLDLDIAGDYLVMAATLVYIKSRMLLPRDQQLPEDSDEEDGDPRWELVRQLVEYKKFKDVALQLQSRAEQHDQLYHATFTPDLMPSPLRSDRQLEAGVFDLITAFQKVLSRLRPEQLFDSIVEDRFTVSDKILAIQQRLSLVERMLFRDLFPEDASRSEVVVTFLALLELIRLRQLVAYQTEAFGEIELVHLPSDSLNSPALTG